jgi:hypothetical protein
MGGFYLKWGIFLTAPDELIFNSIVFVFCLCSGELCAAVLDIQMQPFEARLFLAED